MTTVIDSSVPAARDDPKTAGERPTTPRPENAQQLAVRVEIQDPTAEVTCRATTATITATPARTRGLSAADWTHGVVEPAVDQHLVPPDQLRSFVVEQDVNELRVPDLAVAAGGRWLLELLRGGHPLHRAVLAEIRFDLDDVLDAQLAELVIVLADSTANDSRSG